MALDSGLDPTEEDRLGPAHNPVAPPNELFDISTTIDLSYIISLIRKLVPASAKDRRDDTHGLRVSDASGQVSNSDHMECIEESDVKAANQEGKDDISSKFEQPSLMQRGEEDIWEEYGCVLWDLAASKSHAELMVQNLILEVILANLKVSQSARAIEICIGIIGNLACHEIPMEQLASSKELMEAIMSQLFLDDAQSLCEVCRLINLGLQSSKCVTWAEALKSEQVLSRILWIAENTLNSLLIEKSVGLLLAILESQLEIMNVLLPPLLKLGLPSFFINLLAYEMTKLTSERILERCPIFDVLLRSIEGLSVIDVSSEEICSNRELFQLVCDLIKIPEKVELANLCVTAGIIIANILSDSTDLVFELSRDLSFLQGVLDILPFTSDDVEARNAIWSVIARMLIRVQETDMSQPNLFQYVCVLAGKSNLIEDDHLEHQLEDSTGSAQKPNARTISLQKISSILNQWTALKNHDKDSERDLNIGRLLEIFRKYSN